MYGIYRSLPLLALVPLLLGCGSGSSGTPKVTYSYVDADQQKAAGAGQQFEDPSKLHGKNDFTKSDLDKLRKSLEAAKGAYNSAPSEPAKKKLIGITDELAYETMYCEQLTPHEKYAGALKLYREALALDPKDKEAIRWSTQIIDVYKSMGKPVPE
ncbi:MAG TPA: hypothetical protein VKT78_15155 [Fimbriimonadaceae bacterium]|nr:hypothetical protein [Fimbriimonadaceae bacterium]